MDYKKIYDGYISKCRDKVVIGCYERHHILPRCMGGKDHQANLIHLSPRDHFFVHLLLAKAYNTGKLWSAVYIMLEGRDRIKGVVKKRAADFSRVSWGALSRQHSWVVEHRQEITKKHKRTLLMLAASGAARPSCKSTAMGKNLVRYTGAERHDDDFDEEIRRLRPDWFILSSDVNKAKLVAWLEANNRRPEQTIKNRDEHLLCQLLQNYRRLGSETYDPDFMEKLIIRFPFISITGIQEKKAAIFSFISLHGCRPSQISDDPKERRLAMNMYAYLNQNKRQYDVDFAERLMALAPIKTPDDTFNGLVLFMEQIGKPKGHLRARHPTDEQLYERKMFQRMHDYTNPRRQSYNADYAKRIGDILRSHGCVPLAKRLPIKLHRG